LVSGKWRNPAEAQQTWKLVGASTPALLKAISSPSSDYSSSFHFHQASSSSSLIPSQPHIYTPASNPTIGTWLLHLSDIPVSNIPISTRTTSYQATSIMPSPDQLSPNSPSTPPVRYLSYSVRDTRVYGSGEGRPYILRTLKIYT
jgi:hypothetical protein